MGDWVRKPLEELAVLKKDSWKVGDEEAPYIALEHIEEDKLRLSRYDHSSIVTSNKYRFDENNFLFGRLRPYFRKVVKPKFSGICSTDIWVVGAKRSTDLSYLYYLFANKEFIDLSFLGSSGTKMPRADWDFLKVTEWLVPEEIEEQRAIAGVLSSLDDKIDLLHRQNATLETLAQTLFRQWFIEQAQDDWEEGVLGDLVEFNYGKGLKKSIRTGTGYPVVGSSGVVDYHSEYLVEGPGIVTGRKGTLGEVIYLSENFYPIDTTYYITSNNDSPNMYYEFFLLKSIGFENMNTDSAVPGLNRNNALSVEIIIPPLNLITQYNNYVHPLFQKRILNSHHIHTLEILRDILLPNLMSGEVRVQIGSFLENEPISDLQSPK